MCSWKWMLWWMSRISCLPFLVLYNFIHFLHYFYPHSFLSFTSLPRTALLICLFILFLDKDHEKLGWGVEKCTFHVGNLVPGFLVSFQCILYTLASFPLHVNRPLRNVWVALTATTIFNAPFVKHVAANLWCRGPLSWSRPFSDFPTLRLVNTKRLSLVSGNKFSSFGCFFNGNKKR